MIFLINQTSSFNFKDLRGLSSSLCLGNFDLFFMFYCYCNTSHYYLYFAETLVATLFKQFLFNLEKPHFGNCYRLTVCETAIVYTFNHTLLKTDE